MTFIRIKKIKGNPYAYLVENSWKSKGPRQKVKGYLGRVYEFKESKSIFDFDYSQGNYKGLCKSLVLWQLKNYGFIEGENVFVKDDLIFDPKKLSLRNKRGNDIVIQSHEGFLCQTTIKKLLNFKSNGYEDEVGYKLAKTFVETGINIPKQIFIWAFEKVFKEEGP